MIRAERHAKIISLIQEKGFVENNAIAQLLDISIVTVRRDIKALCKQNLITVEYGGGAARDYLRNLAEPLYETKLYLREEEKHVIGLAVINQVIQEGEAIILDSGTTTAHIAKSLRTFQKKLTVITNDIMVAKELGNNSNITVIILGGIERTSYYSTYGPFTESILRQIKANKAFIGVDAASIDFGISNTVLEEVTCKQLMIANSEETIVVADSSKFGKNAPYLIHSWEGISTVITDDKISQDYITFFKNRKIKTIIGSLPSNTSH
jgi:DeoR/GlpR family transcriptional regulator of sugar metabolism